MAALAVMLVACTVGLISIRKVRSEPPPDYYRILMAELARQHFMITGTPTIFREDARAREFFEWLYNLKNGRDGLPAERVTVPENTLLQFSFLPGTRGLTAYPFIWLREQHAAPTMTFTEPSGAPLALWVYSRQQQLLACVFYEMAEAEALAEPGLRLMQDIDRTGVVSVEGPFPEGKAILVHAYLQPLSDLGLDALDDFRQREPDPDRLDYTVPLLFGSGVRGSNSQVHISGREAFQRLWAESTSWAILAGALLGVVLLTAGSFLLLRKMWQLGGLRRQYLRSLEKYLTPGEPRPRIGLRRFLSGDLEELAADVIGVARERQRLALAKLAAEAERLKLEAKLQDIRSQLDPASDDLSGIDEALLRGDVEELRRLRDEYRLQARLRLERLAREEQIKRERQWEIQWLESEFEAIPPEKRLNEAREAWATYERAQATGDLRDRLHLLKEARKRIPKELRPDRFET